MILTSLSQFQPVSFDSSFGTGTAPSFDMILGMAFCKSYNYYWQFASKHAD